MKQEAKGKLAKLQGRVKRAAGVLTGDKELEREGTGELAAGAVLEGVGKARRKVGELVTDVGKAIKR